MAPLGSVLTAMVTPFDAHGRVDEDAAVRLMHHLADHGSDGVVVAGTTGEAATLSDEEHLRVVELAVEERPRGMTVIAGTGSNDTRHACEMTQKATALGVDATLVVTPYYNRPNRRGIVRHYEEVAKTTDKPILVYNIPHRTGTNMGPDLLAELAAIDGIEGVKQANAAELQLIDGLDLYAGDDNTFARTLDLGGAGGILVASHVVGEEFRRMVDEPGSRGAIDASLQDVFSAMAVAPLAICVKAILEMLGITGPTVRLPYVEADDSERATLREMLERRGLLKPAHA